MIITDAHAIYEGSIVTSYMVITQEIDTTRNAYFYNKVKVRMKVQCISTFHLKYLTIL